LGTDWPGRRPGQSSRMTGSRAEISSEGCRAAAGY
jgi:hypothetical protein